MIKTDNNILFMTAGETCYVVKQDDNCISRLFFGKRVEIEDDLTALGAGDVYIDEAPTIAVRGKTASKKVALIFDGAEILDEKPTGGVKLVGGKTLKVNLCDRATGLDVAVLYTPYARGGFTKSVVVENRSDSSVSLDITFDISACSDGQKLFASDSADGCANGFAAVVSDDCGEAHGDAYGFLCVFDDGDIISTDKKVGKVLQCVDKGIMLDAGGVYRSSDMLCVYSDRGLGGMTRIFHDILRENIAGGAHASRMPVVLFAPVPASARIEKSVRAATELGCDVFAVDGGKVSGAMLAKLSAACKTVGIKLGLRVGFVNIDKSSALFGGHCVADGALFAVDMTDGDKTQAFADVLSDLITAHDIEYIMIDAPESNCSRAVHNVFCTLARKHEELCVEKRGTDGASRYGRSLYYPPCIMRNVVDANGKGSLKSRFDAATFGRLGYALDPLGTDDDVKRAVRAQILSYQDDAALVMNGDLYRTRTSAGDRCMIAVGKDKSKAYAVCECSGAPAKVKLSGLDEHNIYHVRELDKSFSGAALCACGVPLPATSERATFTLHIRQVADFE